MSDEEKIKWFNDQIEWVEDNWGDADAVLDSTDMCSDAPYDLFFNFIEQYRKIKKQ